MKMIMLLFLALCLQGVRCHLHSTSSVCLFEADSSVPRDSITHDSMTRRYLDLVPPRASHLERRHSILRGKRETSKQSSVHQGLNNAVMILDLDKTSIFGNDGNDLGIALQWMEKPQDVVEGLYERIVNPCLGAAFEELTNKAKRLDVVIYTRRPQVIQYRSCFRDVKIKVAYKSEWHKGGQLYFPASVKGADDVMETYCGPDLLEEEDNDVRKALERLFAARNAIARALRLEHPPPLVVTGEEKNIDTTLRQLQMPTDHAVLFDDNKELLRNPQVSCVEPFDKMPDSMSKDVTAYMDQHLPITELEEDLVEYLLGAQADEQCLHMDQSSKRLTWNIPQIPQNRLSAWCVPNFEPGDVNDGVISPVTPLSQEANDAWDFRSPECRPVASLKAAAERAVELRKASGTWN